MRLTEWRRFGELFIECRLRGFGNGSIHSVGRIGSIEAFSSLKLQRPFDKSGSRPIGFYAIKVCDKTGIASKPRKKINKRTVQCRKGKQVGVSDK